MSDVETLLRQQIIEVVAGNAARDVLPPITVCAPHELLPMLPPSVQ